MKKKIFLIFLSLCFILTLGGCGKKTVIDTAKFKAVTEEKQLLTADVTKQYSNYNYIKEATVATNGDYQLEFYVIDNESNAQSMYNTNKTLFESYKGSTAAYSEFNLSNYQTYELTTNGKYYYLSRVENTLLYVSVAGEYKENIKTIVKELGY